MKLYTYLPKLNTALTLGIFGTEKSPNGWLKYKLRYGASTKLQVILKLRLLDPDRPNAVSMFRSPITLLAPLLMRQFADAKQMYLVDLDRLKALKLLLSITTSAGKLPHRVKWPMKRPYDWSKASRGLFLFSKVPHYLVAVKDGVIPKELVKKAATSISFPLLLIPLLKARLLKFLPIWTTRVSRLFGKYKKGDKLKNELLDLPLYVALTLNINNVDLHRFNLFLTPLQKELLAKYKRMQVMRLVPYSWGFNQIYNQSFGSSDKRRIKVARLLKLIADKNLLKPEKVNIADITTLDQNTDKVWGKSGYSKAPVLSVRQLALNHIPRILNADLSYPILINLSGTRVYDGMHRLVKAIINKKKTIGAYKVPDSYIKLLYKTAADSLSMAARKHYLPGKWQHIKEVLRVARRFAGRSLTPVLRASILWHDSAKRDFGAEKHGLNGSKIALQLLPKFGYTPLQVKTIATAIRQHNLDLRIDNLNSFKQTIKRFASPLALLLALADDWRSPDILPVWRKTLSYNIKGKPTDKDAHDLYMHMTKRLSPLGRMPLLKYYGLKYKKSTDKFQKWLDSLTLQLVADRIQKWKTDNNL